MRPIIKRRNTKVYNEYGEAKSDLILHIGHFCSYCERHVSPESALEVEHILPKSKYPYLINSWRNFLLSCKHCNTIKSSKDLIISEIHLPHLNNTFLSFEYKISGKINIHPNLIGTVVEIKAQNLLDLVGLDREPSNKKYHSADNLVEKRKNTFTLAQRYLSKYEAQTADNEIIIDLALKTGFWSIWMEVFQNHLQIRQLLIHHFPNTAAECFDANTQPIFRRKQRTQI